MELIVIGLFVLLALAGWWAWQWWTRWLKRNAGRLRVMGVGTAGGVLVLAGLSQVAPAVSVGWAVTALVLLSTAGVAMWGVRSRTVASGDGRPMGITASPPRIVPVSGSPSGLYALLWWNRKTGEPDAWKVGQGNIKSRIGAHVSANPHHLMVRAWLPCDDHQAWERVVLKDLYPWKINEKTIPGEELFEATPEVEWYLRELFADGTWEDKR